MSTTDEITLIRKKPLRHWVSCALENYFSELEGAPVSELYDLVRKEMEHGLLDMVMRQTQGNQSTAANWLGISRGTLRKKLAELGLESIK